MKSTNGSKAHSNSPPSQYKGGALAKQEPAAHKMTIAGRVKEANVAVSNALKSMADLLSEEGMPVPALAGSYYLMHREWTKVLEKLETAAKSALKDAVVATGPVGRTESGGNKYEMDVDWGGGKFHVVGTESLPTQPDVKLLCAETGLKESQVTSPVVSQEYDPDKVEKLLAAGKLTKEQIDKCRVPRKAKDGSVSVSVKVEKL